MAKTSHQMTVSALAIATTFLTAARQLQNFTGFPINSAGGRPAQSTIEVYGSPDFRPARSEAITGLDITW
ncbi:hypothetical protein GCM10007905_15200 [Mixta theicola]|nr:hypothetical protein GCM10007905_15200 [Mixta theicola]